MDQTGTEPNTMEGGLPDMNIETPAENTAEVGVETAALEASTKQRHVVGDKVFESAQEAIAYANGMVSAQAAMASAVTRQAPNTQEQTPKQKLGALLFEDPDEALEQVQRRAVEQIRTEQAQVDQHKKFWDDFYSKHNDLKGVELVVDALFSKGQNSGKWNGVSLEQGSEILAREAREQILKIKGVSSGGQALPSKPAMVAGSSGASVPKVPAPKPVTTDFVTELRTMRKRG